MFSTLTARGASATLEALSLGADDYVTKASNEGSLDRSMVRLREELIPKIKQFFHMPGQNLAPARPGSPVAVPHPAGFRSLFVKPAMIKVDPYSQSVNNVVRIIVEERIGLAVPRAASIVKVTFNP